MNLQDVTRSYTAILLALTTVAAAESAPRFFESAPPHSGALLIEGGSNVKDWEVRGNVIRGRMRLFAPPGDANALPDGATLEAGAEIRIPVHALTGGTRGMDRRMLEALGADRYPVIEFTLSSLEKNTAAESDEFPMLARGELQIRDRQRAVRVPIRLDVDGTELRLSGVKQIRMTDYGIDPPRALLGALRTHDAVVVHFEWTLDEIPP